MRTWTRSIGCSCGKCGVSIPAGSPMLEIHLPGIAFAKFRCPTCAEVPVPENLPERTEQQPASSIRRFAHVAQALPIDFKARQSGEREPGEDG